MDNKIADLLESEIREAEAEVECKLYQLLMTPDPFYDWAKKRYGIKKLWTGKWYKPWTLKRISFIDYPEWGWSGEEKARREYRKAKGGKS